MGKIVGVYITSKEPTVAAKELEYFVKYLIQRITDDLKDRTCVVINNVLKELGYIK